MRAFSYHVDGRLTRGDQPHEDERLVEATGQDVIVGLRRNENAPRTLPDSRLGRWLRRHRKKIIGLAAERGVSNVRVFGSVARGDERSDSDVDLGVDVDIAQYKSRRSRVRDEVERDAVAL